VLANDGLNTGEDTSDATFTVVRKLPTAFIISPEGVTTLFPNQPITFEGVGDDLEDGVLEGASLTWSSDIDGVLGTGRRLLVDDLSTGSHVITLTVRDSDENTATATVGVDVSTVTDLDGDEVDDATDNCPRAHNPGQEDGDEDAVGDVCDDDDADGDGFPDHFDNCRTIPNDQSDRDGDGFGAPCDNPRYDIGAHTVFDRKSWLLWQRSPHSETVDSWQAASDHCGGLYLAGMDDWVLPTLDEFDSLTDTTRENPALPEHQPFDGLVLEQGWYWTSTSDPENADNAYFVDIANGEEYSFDKAGWLGRAWCMLVPEPSLQLLQVVAVAALGFGARRRRWS